MFNANAEESAKDSLVSEGTNLGAMAQQFYKKPVALGGGGNIFSNTTVTPNAVWSIPDRLDTTASGVWGAGVNAQAVTLTGTPPANSGYPWTVSIAVTPSNITADVIGD